MRKIVITTPPICVNRLYQGRRFLTKEGKEAKESMAWEVRAQWREPITDDAVAVNVVFYFRDRRGMDIDGALKGLLDSLTGLVWKDDRQITELHCFKAGSTLSASATASSRSPPRVCSATSSAPGMLPTPDLSTASTANVTAHGVSHGSFGT